MKENKFVMGGDDTAKSTEAATASPSTATATTQHKRPVRHHVKRRSSGRVHVAKLAPMARANNPNHTDTEADYFEDSSAATEQNRPTMKRSQSQRSLHRMSFDRKGFANLTAARRKSTASSNDKISVTDVVLPTACKSEKMASSNPASLSSSNIAAPVEITFNAVADKLVIPKKELLPKIASPLKSSIQTNSATASISNMPDTHQRSRKQLLRSHFITSSYEEPVIAPAPYKRSSATTTSSIASIPFSHSRSNSASTNSGNLSRTQQKLLLQKQQALVEDENSPVHPRNMYKLNKEFDTVAREYRCIKRYEDPMRMSLMRCVGKLESHKAAATSVNPQQLARLQLGANQHSVSTSIVPTISSTVNTTTTAPFNTAIPHLEQRQIAHRHHHLKTIALTRSSANKRQLHQSLSPNAHNSHANSNNKSNSHVFGAFPWNAAALIDRLFSSSPH
ncbi:hypothetical protein [Parasitella parasitica]|uniref:Uncharacterized protein n=1 Tax=Parasitella parasitica TaxID=35722 RepID=A0A0B7NV86_9FUNG|nr:hypothetical protein [Parasitella parasitica]